MTARSWDPQSDPFAGYTYTDAGTYTITATVTNTNGRSDQASATVTVEPKSATLPRAALEVRPPGGPAPLRVVADATGSSPGAGAQIRRFGFNFGDGRPTKVQRNPVASHVYKKAGSYRLTVRVRDTDGDADESSRVVNVTVPHQLLQAVLRVEPVKGVAPLGVEVDASASSPQTGASVRDYTFDYGDGTVTKPQPDPRGQHTYQEAGTYPVTVTVTDSLGGSGTARKTVKVAEPRPTEARLVVRPEKGIAPLGVKADASKSSPAAGASILTYQFNFDDGGPDAPQQGPEAEHTYKSPGEYTVTVTVTDSNGKTAEDTQAVRVSPAPPKVSLTVSPRSGFEQLTDFTATATASSQAAITGYVFDFGDPLAKPVSSETGVATHEYETPGTYKVKVTVTDENGQTGEADPVTVKVDAVVR